MKKLISSLLLAIVCMLMLSSITNAAVLAANKTVILFDGEKIHGLKSSACKALAELNGIDMDERIGIIEKCVRVLVRSNIGILNKHMDNNSSFLLLILSVMQDSYPEAFDGISNLYIAAKPGLVNLHVDEREFQLDSHGYALTTYTFTSDRLREA